MRVLVVTQYFWPESFRVNDLVSGLTERGHTVTVLTGAPNYPEGRLHAGFAAAPDRYAAYAGASVVRVPMALRGEGVFSLLLNYATFAASAATIGWWRLRRTAIDVVFVFQPSPITACLPALLIGSRARAPILLWVLDLWPETLSAVGALRAPAALALVGRLVRFIYRRCDLILGQSRSFGSNIARYAGSLSRFRYFPGWAEAVFVRGEDNVQPAPEVPVNGERLFNVLFAGNIGEAQDFPTILDAAELLRDRRDIRWLIVGDGRAAASVREEIVRRDLAECVLMLGRFPMERMPEFFAAADALLVTLRRDPVFAMTIPGKLQSYLAAGVPIVGALDGEGARVIEEAKAGGVAPAGDAIALAAHVTRLADTSCDDRALMGRNAREYAEREFDRATLIATLETWMHECIARRRIGT